MYLTPLFNCEYSLKIDRNISRLHLPWYYNILFAWSFWRWFSYIFPQADYKILDCQYKNEVPNYIFLNTYRKNYPSQKLGILNGIYGVGLYIFFLAVWASFLASAIMVTIGFLMKYNKLYTLESITFNNLPAIKIIICTLYRYGYNKYKYNLYKQIPIV